MGIHDDPKSGAEPSLKVAEESVNKDALPVIETDVLVVGAGPAGASLSCFLGQNGIEALMISQMPGTVVTPRSHYINGAGMECLRDLGLEEDARRIGYSTKDTKRYRFAESLVGKEFGRNEGWMRHWRFMENIFETSPCRPLDLTQTHLEPLLVKKASHHGTTVRWNYKLLSFEEQKDGSVESIVLDTFIKQKLLIKSKYLCGADGGRSKIVTQAGLPLAAAPGGGLAVNIEFDANLSKHMEDREALITQIYQPHLEYNRLGPQVIIRMIKPWEKWLAIVFPNPGYGTEWMPTEEELLDRVKVSLGDPNIDVKITNTSRWFVNETNAIQYSKGSIFCLGDAVHRHPPHHGLGGNTSMQDSHNLGWKLAYVLKGQAGPELLSTYNVERQPVGARIVKATNAAFRNNFAMAAELGVMLPDLSTRLDTLALLEADSEAGYAKREALDQLLENQLAEGNGLGLDFGQYYTDSAGVYLDDETEETKAAEQQLMTAQDPVLYYPISTFPGKRLPHAWLNTAIPAQKISTKDLAGNGSFSLLTGIGGKTVWSTAASKISTELNGIPIKVHSIGFGQDWFDYLRMWKKVRGVKENGAVLVRPDLYVCWRLPELPAGGQEEVEAKLRKVMKKVLFL